MKTAAIILQLVASVFLIMVVILQPAKVEGISSIVTGGAETFFGKNKGRTVEGKLQKLTIFAIILFVIVTLASIYILNK